MRPTRLRVSLEHYWQGGALRAELDPGWSVAESAGPERTPHVSLELRLHPPGAALRLCFDCTRPEHMTVLVDVVSHQMLYLTDAVTYEAVRTAPEGAQFGRAILGLPGAGAVQLQDALSHLALLHGTN
jgi:hypothetical protein